LYRSSIPITANATAEGPLWPGTWHHGAIDGRERELPQAHPDADRHYILGSIVGSLLAAQDWQAIWTG